MAVGKVGNLATARSALDETLFDEIKRIQQWIAQDIQNGVKLSEEDKTIAILVRENWQAEAIKAEGKRRGFQIHTHTGGDLYQTMAAIDMLALVIRYRHQLPRKTICLQQFHH